MIGLCDREFYEFREDERQAYPEFFHGDCCEDMESAIRCLRAARNASNRVGVPRQDSGGQERTD